MKNWLCRNANCRRLTASGVFASVWQIAPHSAHAFQFPAEFPRAQLFGYEFESIDVLWLAICAGFAITAWFGLRAATKMRDDDTVDKLKAQITELRAALDRSESMLGADDQRTIIWDSPSDPPRVIGSLPERVSAPQSAEGFLAVGNWLEAESAGRLDAAIHKLRSFGEGFQVTLTTLSDDILEVTGRTSGRRTLARFRELTGAHLPN